MLFDHCGESLADQLSLAAECVDAGGVIAYPTESCYGLGCHPGNALAIQHILSIKQRNADQGLILVASEISQLEPYVDFSVLSKAQRARIEQSWPGPISWLIPVKPGCEPLLHGCHQTLAVRVPAFNLIQKICDEARSALVSTSANHHGRTALTTADAVREQLADKIDFMVDAPIQGLDRPSRIIDARTQQVLRT